MADEIRKQEFKGEIYNEISKISNAASLSTTKRQEMNQHTVRAPT